MQFVNGCGSEDETAPAGAEPKGGVNPKPPHQEKAYGGPHLKAGRLPASGVAVEEKQSTPARLNALLRESRSGAGSCVPQPPALVRAGFAPVTCHRSRVTQLFLSDTSSIAAIDGRIGVDTQSARPLQ
jgi:hypothetical protein